MAIQYSHDESNNENKSDIEEGDCEKERFSSLSEIPKSKGAQRSTQILQKWYSVVVTEAVPLCLNWGKGNLDCQYIFLGGFQKPAFPAANYSQLCSQLVWALSELQTKKMNTRLVFNFEGKKLWNSILKAYEILKMIFLFPQLTLNNWINFKKIKENKDKFLCHEHKYYEKNKEHPGEG